jgi:hypothetical protein
MNSVLEVEKNAISCTGIVYMDRQGLSKTLGIEQLQKRLDRLIQRN